jgi:tripartite-type tricarboxylate transporter receptor subunit TctC
MNTTSTRRLAQGCALAGIALLLMVAPERGRAADAYPSRPIRVIIPYPPGDAADVMARLIGPKFQARTGQPLVVDNRPGASGQIGLALAKGVPADGYTIAFGQGGNMVVAPHTRKNLPYDPLKDFVPVAVLATNYMGIVANPNAPFKTPAEMIAWAKANPGKLTVATNGEGGHPHLSFEHLASTAGFKFQHIPYKGSSNVVTDVIAGQVMVGIGAYTTMQPQVQGGRVRLIGATPLGKVPNKPDLPIFSDVLPGFQAGGWFGAVAPAGTPKEIVAKLNEEINRALAQPDVEAQLTDLGLLLPKQTPEWFGNLIKSDYVKYGNIVKSIGFEPQ